MRFTKPVTLLTYLPIALPQFDGHPSVVFVLWTFFHLQGSSSINYLQYKLRSNQGLKKLLFEVASTSLSQPGLITAELFSIDSSNVPKIEVVKSFSTHSLITMQLKQLSLFPQKSITTPYISRIHST